MAIIRKTPILMPGKGDKYIETFKQILMWIKQMNPTCEEFNIWLQKNFHVEKEQRFFHSLTRLDSIVKCDDKLSLTLFWEKWLDNGNITELYQRISAIDPLLPTILKLLADRPLTLSEILRIMNEREMAGWKTERSVGIRLNWLLSMGYVERIKDVYDLSVEGRKIVEEKPVDLESIKRSTLHDRTVEALEELGRIVGAQVEREFPIEKERLDVVWKRLQNGWPTFVFEVKVKTKPGDALEKLLGARNKWNSKICLVTTTENKLDDIRRIKRSNPGIDVVEGSPPNISNRIWVLTTDEIENINQTAKDAKKKGLSPRLFLKKYKVLGKRKLNHE
jgi:predicted RNA-binding protein